MFAAAFKYTHEQNFLKIVFSSFSNLAVQEELWTNKRVCKPYKSVVTRFAFTCFSLKIGKL